MMVTVRMEEHDTTTIEVISIKQRVVDRNPSIERLRGRVERFFTSIDQEAQGSN